MAFHKNISLVSKARHRYKHIYKLYNAINFVQIHLTHRAISSKLPRVSFRLCLSINFKFYHVHVKR